MAENIDPQLVSLLAGGGIGSDARMPVRQRGLVEMLSDRMGEWWRAGGEDMRAQAARPNSELLADFGKDAAMQIAPMALGPVAKAAQAAPKLASVLAGSGGLLASSSDTGETQSRGQPTEETAILQRKLKDAGFYTGPIDGITGAATQAAREKFEAGEAARNSQALERLKLESETAKSAAEKQQADAAIAETQRRQAALEEETRRRTEGEDRLRQMEQDVPLARRVLRDYGPTVGYGAGALAALLAKSGINKAYNARSAAQSSRANDLMAEEGGDVASRVGRVNQFWGEGQKGAAEVPFLANPGARPPFRSNPNAPNSGELYRTGKFADPVTDATVAGAFGVEAGLSYKGLTDAKAELDAARKSAQTDPSEMNLRRLQSATDNVAIFETLFNAGRVGGPTYLGLGGKMQRQPTRPDVNLADAERLRIEQYLNQQASRGRSGASRAGSQPSSGQTPQQEDLARLLAQSPMPQLPVAEAKSTTIPRSQKARSSDVTSKDLPKGHTYIESGRGSKIKGPNGKFSSMPEKGVQVDDTRPLRYPEE